MGHFCAILRKYSDGKKLVEANNEPDRCALDVNPGLMLDALTSFWQKAGNFKTEMSTMTILTYTTTAVKNWFRNEYQQMTQSPMLYFSNLLNKLSADQMVGIIRIILHLI
jgi:hypothetical protein